MADLTGSFTPVFLLSVGLAVVGLIAAWRIPKSTASALAPAMGPGQ